MSAARDRRVLATLLAAGLTMSAALAGPAMAGEARSRLDRALRSLKDAKASFTQSRTSSLLGAPITPAKGTFEFRAPRQLRMAFGGPAATTILVRGDTAWIEQPKAGQVIRTSARASGAPPLPFLEESVAVIEKAYVIRETGRRSLTLTPRSTAGAIHRLDLVLDARTGMPERVVVRQHDDEEIRLVFGRWTVNSNLPASRFAPTFAAGAKVVDL